MKPINKTITNKKERVHELEAYLSDLRKKRQELNKEIESARDELRKIDPNNFEFGYDPGY